MNIKWIKFKKKNIIVASIFCLISIILLLINSKFDIGNHLKFLSISAVTLIISFFIFAIKLHLGKKANIIVSVALFIVSFVVSYVILELLDNNTYILPNRI